MDISRLYTGPDGQTHLEWMNLESHPELGTLQNAVGIQFRSTEPGNFLDWHPAPRRQFVITLSGEVEIGLGDLELGPHALVVRLADLLVLVQLLGSPEFQRR